MISANALKELRLKNGLYMQKLVGIVDTLPETNNFIALIHLISSSTNSGFVRIT
jgi:hypothetical protein